MRGLQLGLRLGEQIAAAFPDEPVHVIGHSMGGLDARLLLSDPDWSRRVLSLTTIGTPHLGSSIADFAQLRAGRIYRLLTRLGINHRGFLDVTRRNARAFHATVAAPKGLPSFSIAGNPTAGDVCWPLHRFHAALCELEGPNDGLVSVESVLAFGTPLPEWPVDHLRQMNWLVSEAEARGTAVPVEYYQQAIANLAGLGFESKRRREPVGARAPASISETLPSTATSSDPGCLPLHS